MRKLAILLLFLGPPPALVLGDETKDEPIADETAEVTVVVTAAKHGQKITEAPASITVITSEDIEVSGAVSLPDLFRRVPGLDFMQVSARDYNLNARGFNTVLSRRLLVLIDGRSTYVDLMGFTLWDSMQVSLDEIERIEVVRGPGSALYGANASSGVVNIITKSPEQIDGGTVRLGYGEGSTVDVGVLHGQSLGRWGYKVSATWFHADDFDNPDKNIADPTLPREDGTTQPKACARLQYEPEGGGRLMVDAGYGGTTGVLFTGIGPLDIQEGSHLAFGRVSFTKESLYLQAFWNGLGGETLNLTTGGWNTFATNSYDLEAQYNLTAGDRHFLVLGGNVRFSDIDTDLASREEQELLYGIYAQDEWKLGSRFTANVALRLDHDELIGTVLAPKLGLVYQPSLDHSFRLTAATAYNSSSFLESYLDWVWKIPLGGGNTLDVFAYGNPELEPERNTTYELGYRAFPTPKILVDAAIYYSQLKDFVSFLPVEYYIPGIPKAYSYLNVGRATQSGLELALEATLPKDFALSAQYTYTDTNAESDVAGLAAKHKAGLTLQYARRKGLWGSLGVIYSDKLVYTSTTPFYDAGVVPAYTTVNGAVYYSFLDEGHLSVGLRGTNLLDNEHREYILGDILERRVIAEAKIRF